MIPMFKFLCTDKGQHKVRTLGTVASVNDPNEMDGIMLVDLGGTRFSISAGDYVRDENPSASRHPRTGAFMFRCPTCGTDKKPSSKKTAELISEFSAVGVSALDISLMR